jgi:uncharacterized protein DUF6281
VAHTTASKHAVRSAAVLAVTVALLSGCLGSAGCSAGGEAGTFRAMMVAEFGASPAAASCAAAVEFEGRFMMAWSDGLPAVRGKLLGTATYPVCDDGGGCDEQIDTASGSTKVWALRGFDPDEIVVARSEGRRKLVVYARPDAEPEDYFRFAGGRWHLRAHAKGSR